MGKVFLGNLEIFLEEPDRQLIGSAQIYSKEIKIAFNLNLEFQFLPGAIIAEGEKMLRIGEYTKALSRFNLVLREDPTDQKELCQITTDI